MLGAAAAATGVAPGTGLEAESVTVGLGSSVCVCVGRSMAEVVVALVSIDPVNTRMRCCFQVQTTRRRGCIGMHLGTLLLNRRVDWGRDFSHLNGIARSCVYRWVLRAFQVRAIEHASM